MIYLTHPDHGAMHVYSEGDVKTHEARGWVRTDWPPKPKADQAKAEGQPVERAKPGPKPKADQAK